RAGREVAVGTVDGAAGAGAGGGDLQRAGAGLGGGHGRDAPGVFHLGVDVDPLAVLVVDLHRALGGDGHREGDVGTRLERVDGDLLGRLDGGEVGAGRPVELGD